MNIRRTLKNIAVGFLVVPILTGFGVLTGEQVRVRYSSPEEYFARTPPRISVNNYTGTGGLVGLAVASAAMVMEVKNRREREERQY